MFTPSDKCPRRDACVQNGKGLIHMKDLTDKEGLYNHGRLVRPRHRGPRLLHRRPPPRP